MSYQRTLNYHITTDDIIHFNLYHFRHSPAAQKQQRIIRIIVSIGVAILGLVMFYLIDGGKNPGFISYLSAFVSGVAVFFIWPRIVQRGIREQTAKMLAEGKNKGIVGEQTLTLTPDYMMCVSEAGESTIKWSSVERVVTTDEYTFIYISSVNAFIVPRRAFPNNDEHQSFVQYVTDHCHA